MHVIFEFSSNSHFSLPLSHHHIIQGFIYNQLKNNPDYSSFLHNTGFQYGDTERTFKMFTFSNLQGKYQIIGNKICFYENFKLEISSIDSTFCNILINAMIFNKNLEIAYQPVKLEQLIINDNRIEQNSIKIQMLSPVTIHQTFFDENNSKKTLYLPPDHTDFCEAINQNFHRKYQAYYGIESTDNVFIEPISFSQKNKYVTRFKNKIIIIGWNGQFQLNASSDTLNFLYQCGLGSKNSQGFGLFNLLNT